jgi:hypothetical protein
MESAVRSGRAAAAHVLSATTTVAA